MDKHSGVGVVDKSAAILAAVESEPLGLPDLAAATGIARPTCHRIAAALTVHGLLDRDSSNRYRPGPALIRLGLIASEQSLGSAAEPVLTDLRDRTGESTQLYRREADRRRCVATAEPISGLRDTVPVGALLTLRAGSAAQVFAAFESPEVIAGLDLAASFGATTLRQVRERGWATSVAERESGVASVSAPVRGPGGQLLAVISVSGPISRLGAEPGEDLHEPVLAASAALERRLDL